MRKSIFLTVLFGLFLLSTAIADPGDTLWTRTYGGSADDHGYCVDQTTDGGYIVAGYTNSFGAGGYDVYLVRTNADGDTLWTRTYGGSADDYSESVQQTSDGGYIIAGYTTSFGAGANDFYVLKTDADGDTLWTRTYGGTDEDYGYCVEQTTDGGYIIGGETSSFGAGAQDVFLVKTDGNGDITWARTYGTSNTDRGFAVSQTSEGGYIATGYTYGFFTARNLYLVRTDANGARIWTDSYGDSGNEVGYSVQETADGGYIAAGETNSFGAGLTDVWLVKVDADGDTEWTRTFGGTSDDYSYSVEQTTDGGYIVAGFTDSFGAGGYDFYLVKTAATGDSLWTRTYGVGSREEEAASVTQITDGGYIIAGSCCDVGGDAYDVYVVRVTGAGPLPDVSIEIVPDDPPVTVPQGGSFGYTGTLTNNTGDPQVTDVWAMAVGPEPLGYYWGPFREFHDLNLRPHQTRSAHLNQRVRNMAIPGFYNYIAYCGDYLSTIMDSSYFRIEVVSGEGSGGSGWVLTGSFLEGDVADIPLEFALLGNYPNPFNASTVISYELPTTSHVKLEVYNISGQKVRTLVDSKEQAGYRSVTWDASDISSGVYFYKLTAGDFTEIKTMTLLR